MTRVKGHFRHLPNGTLVHIDEYTDKRKKTPEQLAAARGKVVHADEHSTTVVDHKGQAKTHLHEAELSQAGIHGHLNKPLPVNADLAHQVVKHKLGIADHNQFLKDAVQEEGYRSKPRFTDTKGAAEWFHQTHVAPKLKELRQAHGKTTSRAKAAQHKHPDLRDMWEAHATDKDASAHEQAEGKMVGEHAESAQAAADLALEQGHLAQTKGPKDAPKISGLSKDIKFFGHQAQALAQLGVVDNGIVDIDMGGGKGLVLPADALALMTAGKVKKPIIIVPAATLDPNAELLANKYSKGDVNVFKISNEIINKHHGGDIASMVAAIKSASPNTIFMATYDAIAHQDREGAPERFPHAAALGAAGFDYMACDECHNVANEDSARFQALSHLGNAKYKRMASGTFLANDPRGVVGPLKLLHPSMDLDTKKLEQFYGRKETSGEATWSPHGLKKLREHLLGLGMVSLRRSAWMDKLPKREDKLSVVQMLPQQQRVHDAALNDALEQLETDAKTDPLLAKALADDSLDNAWEAPPALMRKLEVLQGITDYPDEMARMVEGKLDLVGKGKDDPEAAEAIAELQKFSPAARNHILSLKGTVSPKANDVYAKIKKHFGDKKNGKFIVFVQRKASANHIMRNMPDELKQHGAMYFDASKMDELTNFTEDKDGPKILVAVDASIKEGVNMQAANGMYRYDHHLTPGNQEQSYARIWRFGQDKPTNIHLGIMDGGMDVAKYARLCSKNWVNQQVVSDFESDKSTPIYKLSVKNLKEKRDASILDDYHGLNDDVLKWQQGENKKYKAKFGEQPYDLATGDKLKGGKPGEGGAYHKGKLKKSDDVQHIIKRLDALIAQSDHILKGSNWAYRQPAHVGSAHDDIGSKITNLPDEKLPRVQEIVQQGIIDKESVDKVARRLRHSVNSAGHSGDDRDWHMVAQTEISNARSRGALDYIIEQYGANALVSRSTNKCCSTCAKAFGRYVERKWRAGSVPDKYRGAVHPRCKCGPWKLVNPLKRRSMRKAMAADVVPMGLVRRRRNGSGWDKAIGWTFDISTGHGTWADVDSVTARAVMRTVLTRCPLVVVEGGERCAWARIGHGRPTGRTVTLVDPLRVMGARYYPTQAQADGTPLLARTRDDYVQSMLQVLPVVVTMPEPWATPTGALTYAPLTDFLGYSTLTDWWVQLPIGQPPESHLATEPTGAGSARALVRAWSKRLLNSDSLAKGEG